MASLAEIQALVEQIKNDLPLLVQRSQVAPKQIVIAEGLSDLSERLGLIQAGEFRAGNGLEPGFGFSGTRMGYPAFAYASDTWHLAGVNTDVLQFGLSATTGKAYFAGGKAVLDVDGAVFEAQNNQSYFLFWKTDDDQTIVGKVGAFYVGTDSGIEVVGQTKTGFVPVAHLMTADTSGVFVTGIEVRGDGEIQMDLRTATGDAAGDQKVRVMTNFNVTNAILPILSIEAQSKGTVAAGFGSALDFWMDDASSLLTNVGYLAVQYTDPTNGSEDTKIMLGYLSAGTLESVPITQKPETIPLVLSDRSGGSAVPAVDVHGSLPGYAHYHLADGVNTILESILSIPVPPDYKGGTFNINWMWSSTVGGNNIRWQIFVRELEDGDTAHATRLGNNFTIAAPAVANTIKLSTQALATDPLPGAILHVFIARIGGDAADTNTGQVSVWGAYFDYEAYS